MFDIRLKEDWEVWVVGFVLKLSVCVGFVDGLWEWRKEKYVESGIWDIEDLVMVKYKWRKEEKYLKKRGRLKDLKWKKWKKYIGWLRGGYVCKWF